LARAQHQIRAQQAEQGEERLAEEGAAVRPGDGSQAEGEGSQRRRARPVAEGQTVGVQDTRRQRRDQHVEQPDRVRQADSGQRLRDEKQRRGQRRLQRLGVHWRRLRVGQH